MAPTVSEDKSCNRGEPNSFSPSINFMSCVSFRAFDSFMHSTHFTIPCVAFVTRVSLVLFLLFLSIHLFHSVVTWSVVQHSVAQTRQQFRHPTARCVATAFQTIPLSKFRELSRSNKPVCGGPTLKKTSTLGVVLNRRDTRTTRTRREV